MATPPWLKQGADGGSELIVHAQPGASRNEVAGEHGDALKVRIAARAVEGAANAALVEFIAQIAGLPKSRVRLLRGDKSRRKTFWLDISVEEFAARL
jgi:uncharacterized protein (TIGR00251 family)